MNLNGILIGSEDPTRLAGYYRKLFGEPGWDGGGYTGWMIGSGSITVGPHSEVHGANGEPGRLIWNIVVEPYTMDGAPDDSFIATLSDPDGNYFQLMSPMDPNAM